MRAHEHAYVRDFAQQRVEQRPIEAVLDRVHPHEDTVQSEELIPHSVDGIVGIHDRLGRHAELGKGRENAT